MPDTVDALVESKRGFVIAAAGCGKTEAIARAVARMEPGSRCLVLTHTHAGVKAIRDRMAKHSVAPRAVRVETIASWALRIASSFPTLSGQTEFKPTGGEWSTVYGAANRVLPSAAVRDVVRSSYSRVFVDEYQDCISSQHLLITAICDLVPCCVLGDPLQGIFGFREPLVDWAQVRGTFEELPALTTPWRWSGNTRLGSALLGVREALLSGAAINLRAAPFQWTALPADKNEHPRAQAQVCLSRLSRTGSIVALRQWARECHAVGQLLRGTFTCMEEMDCNDLMGWAQRMEKVSGIERVALVLALAKDCFSGLAEPLRTIQNSLDGGRLPDPKRMKKSIELAKSVCEGAAEDGFRALPKVFDQIDRIPEGRLFRRELWRDSRKAVVAGGSGVQGTLGEAAWEVRNRLRHLGRALEHRTISRTLLVKGLEFEHAIVLDANEHNARNLYVAMTRPTQSLTLCSVDPVVQHTPALLPAVAT